MKRRHRAKDSNPLFITKIKQTVYFIVYPRTYGHFFLLQYVATCYIKESIQYNATVYI